MSVQHTNLDTSQDKAKPDQEFNNQELVKKNSPDNGVASILLAVAFYLAIVYFAMLLLNPWGILVMIFLAFSFIWYIIATIFVWIGRKKGNKNFLYISIAFYLLSIPFATEAFRTVPILLALLVTVGTVMYKQDNEQTNK
jgi:hypothetical protein